MRKLILLLALVCLGSTAIAQDKEKEKDKESDSLDLKKLEDKYWSAKDSDFSVVQNRTYAKEGRYFATVSYGAMMNDPNYIGRNTNIAVGYYKTEHFGYELAYETADMQDNDSTDFFKARYSIRPDSNRMQNYISVNALWIPIYAKLSFMDKKIMYFDMQFALGIGQMTYQQQHDTTEMSNTSQTTPGINLDLTEQVFFHEHFAVRLDIKNKFTSQKLDRWHLGTGTTRELNNSKSQLDTSILLGLTYFH